MIYNFRIDPKYMWRTDYSRIVTDSPQDLWKVTLYTIERVLKEFFECRVMGPKTKYDMESVIRSTIEKCVLGYIGKHGYGDDWFIRIIRSNWAFSNTESTEFVMMDSYSNRVDINLAAVIRYMQQRLIGV